LSLDTHFALFLKYKLIIFDTECKIENLPEKEKIWNSEIKKAENYKQFLATSCPQQLKILSETNLLV
jgi:hypothetical protein